MWPSSVRAWSAGFARPARSWPRPPRPGRRTPGTLLPNAGICLEIGSSGDHLPSSHRMLDWRRRSPAWSSRRCGRWCRSPAARRSPGPSSPARWCGRSSARARDQGDHAGQRPLVDQRPSGRRRGWPRGQAVERPTDSGVASCERRTSRVRLMTWLRLVVAATLRQPTARFGYGDVASAPTARAVSGFGGDQARASGGEGGSPGRRSSARRSRHPQLQVLCASEHHRDLQPGFGRAPEGTAATHSSVWAPSGARAEHHLAGRPGPLSPNRRAPGW